MAIKLQTQGPANPSFEWLFNHYYAGLVAYAGRFTQDRPIAEDIVHDAFLHYWENAGNVTPAAVKTYLFNSVRNKSLNHLRSLHTRNRYQQQVLEKGEITGLLTWEHFVKSELEEFVSKAVARLPEQQRRVFMMSRFEDKTAVEISEQLGLSPRTVQKHLELALRNLRRELSEYLPASVIAAILFH